MAKREYGRDKQGLWLDFRGMNLMLPPDQMSAGKYPFAQNVRRSLRQRTTGRPTQDSATFTIASSVNSLRRLNDSTPAGPPGGYIIVAGASTSLYANNTSVDTGYSGNPLSLLAFRPSASVQPWMYVGDSNKMTKVRSDGTTYRVGVKEPQASPVVAQTPVTSNGVALVGPVTVYYYGDSPHSGPVGSYIWKNPADTNGSGPPRTIGEANGSTTGSSLLFDALANSNNGSVPVPWTQFQGLNGTVNTSGTAVTWVSGDQFSNLAGSEPITINGVQYTISMVNSATSITLTGTAGTQSGVAYYSVANLGSVPLFEPALESEGYQDFNCCVLATLYIPAAGTYTFTTTFKDDILWGIGGNGIGTATWPAGGGGTRTSGFAQTRTVISGLPLMPYTPEPDGEDTHHETGSVAVTFSAAGNYQFEIDWDYWYHTGRCCDVQCSPLGGGSPQDIQPITSQAIVNSQYRYTYRSSATGATSNPSPESVVSPVAAIANNVTPTASTDPQVDKIDFYRLDTGLLNFTYVGTGPNAATPFKDILLDVDVVSNPILEFDNFEPFPSIDLPKSGVVNVGANGVLTWVSGDQFNVRWLPGTLVTVGTTSSNPNQGTTYVLISRPFSAISMQVGIVQIVTGTPTTVYPTTGNNQAYNIAEPDLAAQRLPHIWGPTDNVAFFFACRDPLRPGTLYWCKGNNPDSAPDTNQQDLTSPSEPLMNGCITNGVGMAFSTERAFLCYPNFFNALATVNGTEGSTWTIQESISNRGLYMEWALAVDGGGNVFFRAKDGIYISPGGQGSRSITDEDLFNLFPHEGFKPQPVTRGGFVIYPPNDNNPSAQHLSVANGYLYYDYQDITNVHRTLVFDIFAGGWVWDVYGTPVTVHQLEEGAGINGTLVGCSDGTIRPLVDSGAETATSVLMMPCDTAGETRAQKQWGDIYIEAGPRGGE